MVYFDDRVRNSEGQWIGGTWLGDDKSARIVSYFEQNTFKRKNSGELGRWMNDILSNEECSNTILVFAQDVVPFEVYDDDTSNALIRQYLDHGGTILWMGDVPFYYKSKAKAKENHFERFNFEGELEDKHRWDWPSPLNVLGVIPASMLVASRFSITRRGRKLGLRTNWAPMRPVVSPSFLEADRTRLSNFVRRRHQFIELAHVEGIGSEWVQPLGRKGHGRRLLEYFGLAGVKAGPVEITIDSKEKTSVVGVKFVSSWIKVFDPDTEGSGFIRVWDFAPRHITDRMLDELLTMLKRYCPNRFKD